MELELFSKFCCTERVGFAQTNTDTVTPALKSIRLHSGKVTLLVNIAFTRHTAARREGPHCRDGARGTMLLSQ